MQISPVQGNSKIPWGDPAGVENMLCLCWMLTTRRPGSASRRGLTFPLSSLACAADGGKHALLGLSRCSPLLPAKRTLDVSALLYILKSHKRFSILRLRVSAIKLPKDKTYIFDHHQSLLTIFFLNLGLTASILFVCFLMEMPKDVNNTVYG